MALNNICNYSDNTPASSIDECEMDFRLLAIADVYPNPDQPRKLFDKQALEELALSIKANGVIQPILVRQVGKRYQIVSGERRYRACKLAGIRKIPAVIRKMDEQQTLLTALIENIQRQNLNPIEEAHTLRDILVNHGLTHDELAERVGRSRSALTNRLRLLQNTKEVQAMIVEGHITPGRAKMLAGLKTDREIKIWAKKIIKEQLSVYETEKQLANKKRCLQKLNDKGEKASMKADLHVRAVEENLQELLGAKVKIRQGKSKGRIEIEFYDKNDLERVIETMVSICL